MRFILCLFVPILIFVESSFAQETRFVFGTNYVNPLESKSWNWQPYSPYSVFSDLNPDFGLDLGIVQYRQASDYARIRVGLFAERQRFNVDSEFDKLAFWMISGRFDILSKAVLKDHYFGGGIVTGYRFDGLTNFGSSYSVLNAKVGLRNFHPGYRFFVGTEKGFIPNTSMEISYERYLLPTVRGFGLRADWRTIRVSFYRKFGGEG